LTVPTLTVLPVTVMKTNPYRRLSGFVAVVAFGVSLSVPASAQSQSNKLRIGVYDSRAVAIAYANSGMFQDSLKTIRTDYDRAKQANDSKRVKEIDARMKLQQRRLHEQGFSTGSVAYILARVKDSLPAVAQKANVRLLVSKWELNYSSAEVETVDVTDELVALFHPTDKVLEWVKGCRNRAPLPMEAITDDMD
jgi:hypothetical protein